MATHLKNVGLKTITKRKTKYSTYIAEQSVVEPDKIHVITTNSCKIQKYPSLLENIKDKSYS